MKILTKRKQNSIVHIITALYKTAKDNINIRFESGNMDADDYHANIDNIIFYAQQSIIDVAGINKLKQITNKYNLGL